VPPGRNKLALLTENLALSLTPPPKTYTQSNPQAELVFASTYLIKSWGEPNESSTPNTLMSGSIREKHPPPENSQNSQLPMPEETGPCTKPPNKKHLKGHN